MAAGINIQVTGMPHLLATLQNLPKEKVQDIADEFEAASYEVVRERKKRAPKDVGQLGNAITNYQTVHEEYKVEWEVAAQRKYAGYVEFGTKSKAVIPAELQEVAAQFKVKQVSGISAKDAIYAWAKRKGIDEKAWYLVYRSIMTNGIRPNTFYYPTWYMIKPKLIERIKRIINE